MLLSVLRPRAAALVPVRLFSSAAVRRSDAFTLAVSDRATQGSVLDVLKRRHDVALSQSSTRHAGDDAAVVLASPGLAGWLEDEAFMSRLLQQLFLRTDARAVSVLSAVVDGVGRFAPAGLSIAHGPADTLLPGLWQQDDGEPSRDKTLSHDIEAALTFALPPIPTDSASPSALRVTVPLANTVFQNGRRSTLFASRWSWQTHAYERTQQPTARTHQVIVLPACVAARAAVPLVAATKPRTILAGLGNIVRQVEGDDGQPMPASRELESAIPALLAARRKDGPENYDDSAVGVWGLVVPPDVWPLYARLQHTLTPLAEHSTAAETQAVVDGTASMAQLLAAGCRLHRILSGGGGWGKKQGLLSLDPETGHTASESDGGMDEQTRDDDDDAAMDRFMRSLRGETEAQDGDLAQPGALVQFFVAPLSVSSGTVQDASVTVELGAQAAESAPQLVEKDEPVKLVSGIGAVSGRGLFLDGGSAHTKVDVPASAVWA